MGANRNRLVVGGELGQVHRSAAGQGFPLGRQQVKNVRKSGRAYWRTVAPPPRRDQVWTVAGSSPRRVLIYSGNMFNELPDVPYVITMEVAAEPDPMEVELPDGLRVAYTHLDHVPKHLLGDMIGEVSGALRSGLTPGFMVITTQ